MPKGETAGERERRLRRESEGRATIGRPDRPVPGFGHGDGPTEGEPDDPWANFDAHPEAWGFGGPPPADLVAPRGTKQWRQARERRLQWEGNQIHTNSALTGLDIGRPGDLEKLLEMSGIWKFHPEDPNRLSHKFKLWTGQLAGEPGGGMTNIGGTDVPFATQRYQPDWLWNRNYAVQGGHLLKGAVAGEYISPRGDGTAVVEDQFGNPIRVIPWPPNGNPPGTSTHPDTPSATTPPANPNVAPVPQPTPTPPPGPGNLSTAPTGFGMTPQQTQALTNSMSAGFGIPAMSAPGGGGGGAQAPGLSQPPPSTETTIKTKKTGFNLSKPAGLAQQQPAQPQGGSWYSGFGI